MIETARACTPAIAVLSASLALFAGSQAQAQAPAPTVVASIQPLHSLVSAVMEGVGEPELLVRGANSPHDYSMTPADARALSQADLVVWVGESMELVLARPISALAAKAVVLEAMEAEGVEALKGREGGAWEAHADHDEHEAEGHGDAHGAEAHKDEHAHEAEDHKDEHAHEAEAHKDEHAHEAEAHKDEHAHEAEAHEHEHAHGALDGHIWLDPRNAMAIGQAAAEVLARVDPANAARYRSNAESLIAGLRDLEQELAATLAPVRSMPYIVFHDAYQYFERRFGLNAVGSITISPDRAPGAKRISEIRERLHETGAVCVFAEPQFEPALARTVVEGTETRIGVLDPLGADLAPGPAAYERLLRGLAASLSDCLTAAS